MLNSERQRFVTLNEYPQPGQQNLSIQSLLCAEAISAAQNLAKTVQESPKTSNQQPQSYASITQAGLPAAPPSRIQPIH